MDSGTNGNFPAAKLAQISGKAARPIVWPSRGAQPAGIDARLGHHATNPSGILSITGNCPAGTLPAASKGGNTASCAFFGGGQCGVCLALGGRGGYFHRLYASACLGEVFVRDRHGVAQRIAGLVIRRAADTSYPPLELPNLDTEICVGLINRH